MRWPTWRDYFVMLFVAVVVGPMGIHLAKHGSDTKDLVAVALGWGLFGCALVAATMLTIAVQIEWEER